MNILVISENPHKGTGFGGQCGIITKGFKDNGHNVSLIAVNSGVKTYKTFGGVPTYTSVDRLLSVDLCRIVEMTKPDAIVILSEIAWIEHTVGDLPTNYRERIFHWVPVDCKPFPYQFGPYLNSIGHVVYMASFGKTVYEHYINPPTKQHLIYHGVDTDIFKPCDPEKKAKMREALGIDPFAFVLMHVGKNQYRKQQPLIMEAYRSSSLPDNSVLIMHTNPGMAENHDSMLSGWDLIAIQRNLGIEPNRIMFTEHTHNVQDVASLYQLSDAFIMLSAGEGFGVPLIEAMATGIDVISANNTTSGEILNRFGRLVKCNTKQFQPSISAYREIADVVNATMQINKAYWEKNSEARQEVLKEMVAYTKETFGIENIQKQWCDVVESNTAVFKNYPIKNPHILYQGQSGGTFSYCIANDNIVAAMRNLGEDVVDLPIHTDMTNPGKRPTGFYAPQMIHGKNIDVHIRWTYPFSTIGMIGKRANIIILPYEMANLPHEWLYEAHTADIDAIVALSESGAQHFKDMGFPPNKCYGMPLGINHGIFKPEGDKYELPNVTENTVIFILFGALMQPWSRKRADLAIDTFCNTFTAEDDVMLVIKSNLLTDNTLPECVRQYAGRKDAPKIVSIFSELPAEQCAALLRRADVMLNCVSGEGFGMAALEAMACGCVPISTRVGGLCDFITEKNSYVVESKVVVTNVETPGLHPFHANPDGRWRWYEPDRELMKTAMVEAAMMVDKRVSKRAACISTAKKFTWSRSAITLSGVIDDVLAR
jgi:glycosyltransferase involved in cell wall biosynthesis